ncbi:alanine racemase [Microbacterium sp. Clip185]|uniref:alanine racemase n=1 Tax=Microbacterium sp. Clip185 TaxID=3025663 RepID=UPI002365EC88|nr:alanine racemase [Microbacterium sp. Clip185]WDG19515.1 alanine racemase [Microbacterium sp. Clip185]
MSAVLHVDLDRLARNIAVVRARVAPAALMLVVKDDAYGHGVTHVVRRAVAEGVGWIGAFDVATALEVRAAVGQEPRVFVWMIAGESAIRSALDADLDLGVGDAELLEEVADAARARGTRARIHLKIDTGLHRNGIRPEEWSDAVARVVALAQEGVVELAGVWSHIAEASDEEDDLSRAAFERAVAAVTAAGFDRPLRHLAASAASSARAEFRYDLVRVGAFCYGIRPAGGPTDAELGISPIGSWDARVISVDGDRVRIDAGALDGLVSALSGLVDLVTPAGPRRLLAVDEVSAVVSGWDGARVGDVVRIYGTDAASPTDLAEAIGTIGEEIALRVSPLVERRYR